MQKEKMIKVVTVYFQNTFEKKKMVYGQWSV